MEIERKYKLKQLPENLFTYEHVKIKQGYISTEPVIRIRQYGNDYILTVKGKGLLAREEFELPLIQESFERLALKVDGLTLHKTRYRIPFNKNTIELDHFHDEYEGLYLAEVEFSSIEEANAFIPPDWFGEDVTLNAAYQNSNLSKQLPNF